MDLYTAILLLCLVMNVNGQDVLVEKNGANIKLKCPNRHNKQNCQWQRRFSTDRFVDLTKASKYLNQDKTGMTIPQFSYVDGGSYRCKCYNADRKYKYSHIITIDTADKGTDHLLSCRYVGTYYRWKRHRLYDMKIDTYELKITKVQFDREGLYTCESNYRHNWYRVDYYLVIQDIKKPKVIIPWPTYAAAIGSDFLLECRIGQTLPVTTELWWKKANNGHYVNVSGSNQQRYQGGTIENPSLLITNVTSRDSGEYRCYGHNRNGDNFVATQILAGYAPHVKISQEYYISRVGVNVTIRVMNVHPGTTMTWRLGESHIFNVAGKAIGDINNPFLTIINVKLDDAGNYTLCVSNRFGMDCDYTVLKVISATITGTRKVLKKANDSITIKCEVTGGGRVIWRRNGEQLKIVNQKSVHIDQLNRFHKGNYTCETSLSTLTAKSDILQLDVEDIPLVTTTSKKVEVNKGFDTVLLCLHDSNPTPTHVYWTKNGVNISAYRSTKYNGSTIEFPSLVIYNTGKSDSGTYICSVSNKIGIGYSKPLQLVIRELEKQTSQVGAVVGILVAIVFVVVVVVGVVIWRRRKQKPGTTKRSTAEVSMHRAADDSHLSTRPIVAADTEYHNVSDVTSTCIRVEDLKTYIQKRQRHEELKKEYKSIPNIAEHPTTHAQTKDNMPKNRFKTTFPYDHTRIILKSDGGSDYINANYIDGFEKERCYIASQGPVKNTVADHWKMIWQENIHQIVMVTNLVEGIKTKCEQYWPCGGKQMVHGNLIIRLNAEKERTAYVTREMSIEDKKSGKKRNVTQYHFTAWPDHGTPDPLYLVLFHRHVISDSKAGHSGPLLVHCSAGIGRTGTYIALDALLEEGRTTGFLDIFKFLKKMRYSRMNMIQTSNQYVCLHYALLEAFTMKDTKIRKDEFSEVWQSIRTDHKALNHQRLNKEFKELEQHVGETKGLSPSMLNATKDDQNHNQYNAAMSTTNVAKNRNKDVLPMDDKRVYLVSYGKGRSDYINAVQVPSYTKFVGYITTQLPLPDTKVDFWTMIRDHSSSTIVLIINKENEADLVYSQSGDDLTIGPFGIKISARKKGENDITKITMVLSRKDDKPRQVVLFQAICNSIPDPAVVGKLADLISTRANMSNDPITVVSSDGAKNCGLFCAFTNAVSSMQIDNHADIFQLVRLLQLRRPEFFTDFEEYKRCYEALNLHLESANVYANF